MKTAINWKLFWILLTASILSVFAIFPYIVTIQGDVLKQIGQPLIVIFLLQLIQSTILFSITIFIGLFLAKKIDFHLPILEAYLSQREPITLLKEIAPQSFLLGIVTAISIYGADTIFSQQGVLVSTHQNLAPIWQKLLAAFYGGITEEILMRLFLMTLLIWVGTKITRKNPPGKITILISILIASIIFGLGHLPITATLTKITPLVVTRAIVLNGIGGIVFGWLYWKKGLESAILAHFTADIFLLTLLPLLIR